MAVPHFSVSIVARGSGRSAVLSAAYRHCARMEYEREARKHRKVKGLGSKVSPTVFAYAARKHAISFHTCMAAVLSSR